MSTDLIFDALLEKIASFQQITPRFAQLLKAGNRPAHLWFMYEGFAREIGHDEEYERTSWFYFAGDFMYSYPSFFSQLPAFRDIEIIDKSTLIEISYKDLIGLRHDFEELNLIFDLARDQCESERARYAAENHTLSAGERYEQYYQKHKPLFNIARHKDIASFLRIKSDGFRRYNH
jgi:hypothetical protein